MKKQIFTIAVITILSFLVFMLFFRVSKTADNNRRQDPRNFGQTVVLETDTFGVYKLTNPDLGTLRSPKILTK